MILSTLFSLILSLHLLRAEEYECKNSAYPKLSTGWKEVVTPYCDFLDEKQAKDLNQCLVGTKSKVQEAVDHCQMVFKRDAISLVNYLKNICDKTAEDMVDYNCCVTDTLLKTGADPQEVYRSSLYTKCLDNVVKPK